MIKALLTMEKSNPVCKKLLLLTEFLPISDSKLIAEEMGYIKEDTAGGIKSGLDILSTSKNRCLKKFKQILLNSKNNTQ